MVLKEYQELPDVPRHPDASPSGRTFLGRILKTLPLYTRDVHSPSPPLPTSAKFDVFGIVSVDSNESESRLVPGLTRLASRPLSDLISPARRLLLFDLASQFTAVSTAIRVAAKFESQFFPRSEINCPPRSIRTYVKPIFRKNIAWQVLTIETLSFLEKGDFFLSLFLKTIGSYNSGW